MKKKLLSLAMAAIMVLGLSTTAFAAVTTNADAPVVKVVTGDNAPSETYTFTVTGTGYTNTPSTVTTQPTIPDVTITTSTTNGVSSDALDLSNITEIGIYTYTITESVPTTKTAGITYDTTTYTLKVTAYIDDDGNLATDIAITDEDGNKVEAAEFKNIYTASTLTVTKNVTGNLGDTNKEFYFTVTFENKNAAITWVNAISASASGVTITANEDGLSYTFTLKSGASATFTNVPSGISYTVTESDYSEDGYTAYTTYVSKDSEDNVEGSEVEGTMDSDGEEVTITNEKDQTVDTGIILDSAPYIMILALVLLGAAYVISRRRLSDRY